MSNDNGIQLVIKPWQRIQKQWNECIKARDETIGRLPNPTPDRVTIQLMQADMQNLAIAVNQIVNQMALDEQARIKAQ